MLKEREQLVGLFIVQAYFTGIAIVAGKQSCTCRQTPFGLSKKLDKMNKTFIKNYTKTGIITIFNSIVFTFVRKGVAYIVW